MTPLTFHDEPPSDYVSPRFVRRLPQADLHAIYEHELHADIAWARVERRKRELNISLAWDIVIIGCLAIAAVSFAALGFVR